MARNDLNGKVVLIAAGAKNLGGLLSRKVQKSLFIIIAIAQKQMPKKPWLISRIWEVKHFYFKQI